MRRVNPVLKILVVEDTRQDVELVERALETGGFACVLRNVQREDEYLQALDEQPDVVLCDYVLPRFGAVQALELLRATGRDTPFIVISSQVSEEVVASAIRLGADDYLLKDRLARLGPAIVAALERRQMRSQARRAREERQQIEERFRVTFEHAAVGIAHTAFDGRYLLVNDRFCAMVGYARDELLRMTDRDLVHPGDARGDADQEPLPGASAHTQTTERRYVRKDGSVIWLKATVSLVRDAAAEPLYFVHIFEDVTEGRRAQERVALLQDTMLAISKADGLETALRTVLQKICESTGWSYGEAWLPDASGGFLESRAVWHDGSARARAFQASRSRLALEDPSESAVQPFVQQQARWLGDLAEGRFSHRDAALAAGFGSWVGVPVIAENQALALLDFFVDARHESPELRIVSAVDVVASQLGMLVKRKAAEESLRESEEKFRQLADNIPQIFWITDESMYNMAYVSAAYAALTGLPVSEPNRWAQAIHPDDRARVEREWMSRDKGSLYDTEFRLVHVDGSVRWVRTRAFPVRNAAGDLVRVAGITEDITERKRADERLLQLAHYDQLTLLPNRVLFYDRLKQALAQARRNAWSCAVLFLDLDRFKAVNDLLGHARADELLVKFAERLTGCVRGGDTVGRLGGDEFCVVLSKLSSPQDAGLVAQSILNALDRPFTIGTNEVYATASIGIAIYPSDSNEIDALVSNADAAMYSAKAAGRGVYRFYTAEMNQRASEKMHLEAKLRRALERGEFLLHFQPKADVITGEIAGFEALLRWQPPDSDIVAPGSFIPLLEETGLIVPVGEWAIATACAQLRAWKDARVRAVPIAVNLSSRQLQQQDFCAVVARLLREHGVAPRLLELEITESAAMEHPEASIAMLRELRMLGVKLSIDDFGTGYSSLSYLKRLPVDTVKIDRSFVTDLATDPDDASIAQAIITMAHTLNLKVVAEGVETAAQLSFLASHACDQMQGYYFSRPVAWTEATDMLRQNRQLRRPEGPQTGERTLLLLVEEPHSLAALQRLLQRDGYRILTALKPDAGFEILATESVAVVVCDQCMPGMTGVEFLRRVKELYPNAVCMVLSGETDLETVTDAINHGAIYRFLTKPWEDGLLRAHIAEAFRRYAAMTESARRQQEAEAKIDELSRANFKLQMLLAERSGAASAGAAPNELPTLRGRMQ